MKQNQKKQRFQNDNLSKYLLSIKDVLLEEEYLSNQFNKYRLRGKLLGFTLFLFQIFYMILSFNKDVSFMEGDFIVLNSLITLIYVLIAAINYISYRSSKIIFPILLFALFVLQGFSEFYIHHYYHNFLIKNKDDDDIFEDCLDFTHQSELKGISQSLISFVLVGCVVSFKFRIVLCLIHIIGIKGVSIYSVGDTYERVIAIISCVVTISIALFYFYFQERNQRCAFLHNKRGNIYKETIDKMIPQNIITAKFDSAMSRLSFFSSNSEASKQLGVNNESNFQQFLESCQIDRLDASPIISTNEFDNTLKRLSGTNGLLTLKQVCKEILIRQSQSNQQKPSRSFTWQQNQNLDGLNNNSQIYCNYYKQSGTMPQIPSQCILPSPVLNKKQKSRNFGKKNSMKIIDLKPTNKRNQSNVSNTFQMNTNAGLVSVNELRSTGFILNNNNSNNVNNSFYTSDNVYQYGTFNQLSAKSTAYSCFSGEIKQDDGVKKRVNIRIWSYKLIEDYVVVCIEDQSFKQQFSSQKDKNIVMQYFLQYYITKQEDLTKKSLVEQKYAYSHLRLPLMSQRQKTITIDQMPSNFTQQVRRTILAHQINLQDNTDAVSIIDSPKNINNNLLKIDMNNNSFHFNSSHQGNNSNQTHQNQPHNNLRISFLNSPQQNPISNPYINSDMLASQIDDINLEFMGEERKTIFSQPKQQYQSKSYQKRLESADTSLHADYQLKQISNQNEMDSKQTLQPIGIPFSNDNTYHFSLENRQQVQQSQGDISVSNHKNSVDSNYQKQELDTPKIQDEILEERTRNNTNYRNIGGKLRESKSLSPRSQNFNGHNSQLLNQRKKDSFQIASPLSSKNNKRSLTYHQFSNAYQNNLSLANKISHSPKRERPYQQKLSLIKTLNNHYERQLSDSDDESFIKLQKVNQQYITYGSKNSISSNQPIAQMFSFMNEQQSPTLTQDGGIKPSIFQTLARSPTNETDKTQNNYNQSSNQDKTLTLINALKNIQKSEFYMYQAKYLTQNYNILQSFLFQNKSFKYSLLNTQIVDLVKGILHVCSPLIERKQLKILFSDKNLDDESNRNLYQDKERLTIMLFNIIFNTLTYCRVKSQISIYFQAIHEISKEEDNGQNSIMIQDHMSSSHEIPLANNIHNTIKEEEYFKDIPQNMTIPKNNNKSYSQLPLTSPTKQHSNALNHKDILQQTNKRVSISLINNMRDNSPLDPNHLRLIIINECEDQQSSLYKIEESNKTNPEQLLQSAMQIIQQTNQQEQQSSQQQQNVIPQESTKNTYQNILKKRISQQYIPEQKLFSQPSDEYNNPRAQISRKHTVNAAFATREPAQTIYFNQLQSSQTAVKTGIIVAKYILRKIGPYEKITYSGVGSSQIKTELIIYKDLRLLEPEQPLRTRQTIYSYQHSQGSTQNIPPDREIKSKFYSNNQNSNNNTFIQNRSIQSKSQIPMIDQFIELNNDKTNNEDDTSISKQIIDKKIKRKFGEQPVYFEEVNERDKHNSSAISEDYSRASIPIERPNFNFTSPVHQTLDIKNTFTPM